MELKLSVMAVPADEHKGIDPYNYILNAGLKAQGITVHGGKRNQLLKSKKYDVLHIHKPEIFLAGKSAFAAWRNFFILWLKIVLTKLRGKKVVWTVHNLFNFKTKHTVLKKRLYSILFRYTDGYVTLTKQGATQLVKMGVPAEKISVIPHPHCIGYYPDTVSKNEARRKLGVPAEKFIFLFAGNIRGHKNLGGLIKAFQEMKDPNSALMIAGKIHSNISRELEECARDTANIFVFPQFIEDEDVQLFLNAADLVVLPYHKASGFGTTFLNLSFARPTLASKTENFLELQQQVGPDWIKTFSGPLGAVHLRKSKAEVEKMTAQEKPDLSPFDWNSIARATKTFYLQVLTGKSLAADKITHSKKEGFTQPARSSAFNRLPADSFSN